MNQIKYRESGDHFWLGIHHTDHISRSKHDIELSAGSSYLTGRITEDSYILIKIHLSPDHDQSENRIQLFKALDEMASSSHREIISDGVIAPSERRKLEEIIQQGHVRKDLPFGMASLTSSRKVNLMNPSSQSRTLRRAQMLQSFRIAGVSTTADPQKDRPQMTRVVQVSLWSLSDSLARSLREPQGEQPGDSRWTVSGLSFSSWSVSHPDLEILESGESPLVLRIKKIQDGKWGVIGQNQLKNLLNSKVLSTQKTPPDNNWDIDNISKTAAGYFQEEKQKITDLKGTMTPTQTPGSTSAPAPPPGGEMGGPGGGMPMASRRASATLAHLRQARDLVARLQVRYASQGWCGGVSVINDREGVGIRVRLAGRPPGHLRGFLGGLPVEWVTVQGKRLQATVTEPAKFSSKKNYTRLADMFEPHDTDVPTEEEQEKLEHEERVRSVYKHLLEHRRAYSSIKYLARVLEMDPHKLSRALGELMAQGKIDFTSRKFRPVPPQKDKVDRVSVEATSSKFRTDKGNWLHDDQLQTTSTAQFTTYDAPEEEHVNHETRVMPDPDFPN